MATTQAPTDRDLWGFQEEIPGGDPVDEATKEAGISVRTRALGFYGEYRIQGGRGPDAFYLQKPTSRSIVS